MKKIILHRRLPVMGEAREPGTEIAVGDPKKAGKGELVVSAAEARELVAGNAAAEIGGEAEAVSPEAEDKPAKGK